MTTTLEKVIVAQCNAVAPSEAPVSRPCFYPKCHRKCRETAEAEARAAIQALMKPSEHMLGSAANTPHMQLVAKAHYQAMLQAILDEERETA